MKKVDRLGWAAGVSLSVYGARIGVRANRREVLESALEYLDLNFRPSTRPRVDHLYSVIGGGSRGGIRRYNVVYADGLRLDRSLKLEPVLESLENDFHAVVGLVARTRVFAHAGVVGWKGRAIVLPGESGCGKSTLVAELVRRGAECYSDEWAVIDSRGRVHPYPRRLALKQGAGRRPRKMLPSELGGRWGSRPLPVGLIAFTGYREGGQWRPRRLTPGRAALELLAHTVAARRRPKRTMETLGRVVAKTRALKGVRGEGPQAAATLLARWVDWEG